MWEPYKKGFKAWLQLEKSLAENSVEAYLRDIDKLTDYLQVAEKMVVFLNSGIYRTNKKER